MIQKVNKLGLDLINNRPVLLYIIVSSIISISILGFMSYCYVVIKFLLDILIF